MDPDDLEVFDSVLGKAMKRCTCPPNHANLLVQMVAICYNRFTISFVNLRHINRICEAYFRPIYPGQGCRRDVYSFSETLRRIIIWFCRYRLYTKLEMYILYDSC